VCEGWGHSGDSPDMGVPLVLRPDFSTWSDGVEYYKVVGTANIEGGMRDLGEGELFDKEFVEEVAKRDEVEFHMR
jgi:hypothetical protein